MSHTLIVGQTESGKTTLAKILARELRNRGVKIAVLDPITPKSWGADYATDQAYEFLDYCKKNFDHYLFIDESATTLDKWDKELFWLATTSRHYGHSATFIVHRGEGIAPTIRNNCSTLFIFATTKSDMETLGKDWGFENLSKLRKLGRGEFYVVKRFAEACVGKVDFESRTMYYDCLDQSRTDEAEND